jgi:catechol 2,3-dioxygenase
MNPDPLLLPSETALGHVHYTTADLDKQLDFHTRTLGLQLHWREDGRAGLGAGRHDLVRFTEKPGAERAPKSTGMYHFALLLPDRKELARLIARLYKAGVSHSPTDHVFTKTTYLDDPEGNTIEVYTYSLEDGEYFYQDGSFAARWADGRPSSGREPLDLENLFDHLGPDDSLNQPVPEAAEIGHVHLYASDLDAQMAFYRDVLGFRFGGMGKKIGMAEVELERPHVIAFNIWQGRGIPPAPKDALGLRYYTMVLPEQAALDEVLDRVRSAGISIEKDPQGYAVHDPAGIQIILTLKK